jgi:subtilisin family serine protease
MVVSANGTLLLLVPLASIAEKSFVRPRNRTNHLGLFGFVVFGTLVSGVLHAQDSDVVSITVDSGDSGAGHGHKYHSSRVIVRFQDQPSFLPDSKSNHALGADNVYVVENPPGLSVAEAVRHYREDPSVLYVEPDYEVNTTADPTDPLWTQQWDMVKIAAPQAWDTQTSASDVIVAVIDTGVDLNHPDLQANLWTNPSDGSHGFTCMNGTCSPGGQDDYGHGTHVAGTIGAVANNGIGIAGINWRTQILSCKFLGSNGSGNVSDAILCFNQILALKQQGFNVRVTNNSWGGGGFSQALKEAMDAVESAGVVNVCAAGNSGVNADLAPMYPGAYDNRGIVSVLASDQSDLGAYFTNYGIANVDIAAPGVSTLSTVPKGTCSLCDPSGYKALSGTSMATPHVAGVLAAVFQANPRLSAYEARDAVLDPASYDALSDQLGGMTGGRLNLLKALTNPILSTPNLNNFPVLSPGPNIFANAGDTVNLTATASDPDGDPLRMVWVSSAPNASTLWLFGSMLNHTFPNPNGDSVTFQAPALARAVVAPYAVSVSDGRGGGATALTFTTIQPTSNPGKPPSGSLSVSPTQGPVGSIVSVYFSATDPEGGPVAWDLWQSGLSSGFGLCCQTGAYSYSINQAGVYRIAVQAMDSELNVSDRQTAVVRIGGATGTPPVVAATFDKLTGTVPLTVNVDMSGSTDSDGTVQTYTIVCNYATGGLAVSGPKGSCSYDTPGSYWMMLIVKDNAGLTDRMSAYVIVTPPSISISSKTPASVTLSSMTMNYTGGTLAPSATTNPPGLAIAWTNAPQSQPGSYAVTATVNDPNYQGSASGTFIINKTTASVLLSNITQTYTGGPLKPTATTNPPGLTIAWINAPQTNPGSYTVTATVNDPDYQGSANGTFTISSAPPPPPPPPSTPPSVSITNPLAGVLKIGTITIQAAVTQGTNPIAHIDFLVNGNVKCSDTAAPYICSWKMPGAPGKNYQIQAQAYDTAGQVGASSVVNVTSSR